MFDDLATHFCDYVVGSFEEYGATKASGIAGRTRDTRAAVRAPTALYHFREHLPAPHGLTRAAVSEQCPDYDLVGDVVNAAKHRYLTKRTPQLRNACQIEEQIVITTYEDEQGPYQHVEKCVLIELQNGLSRDLIEVLTNVMNFWQSYLHSIGVIQAPRTYTAPKGNNHKSRAECGDGQLDFELARGLRFRQSFRLQKYNYAENKVEPVDLTGADVKFTISPRPRHELTINLKNADGHQVSQTIRLSEDEVKRSTASRMMMKRTLTYRLCHLLRRHYGSWR